MNMHSSLSLDTDQKMLKNIKGLMLGRIVILTLLLTITFLFQISEKKYFFVPMTNNFYYFIGLFYLVTIVYSFFSKKCETSINMPSSKLSSIIFSSLP